jgi:hypothetical protein
MKARPAAPVLVPMWNRRGGAVKNGKLMGLWTLVHKYW